MSQEVRIITPIHPPFISRWNNPLITMDPNFQRDIQALAEWGMDPFPKRNAKGPPVQGVWSPHGGWWLKTIHQGLFRTFALVYFIVTLIERTYWHGFRNVYSVWRHNLEMYYLVVYKYGYKNNIYIYIMYCIWVNIIENKTVFHTMLR